jgi:hypothetical protein
MPILHFSGNFKFQLPYFNNEPKNDARKPNSYDLQLNNDKLKGKFDKNARDCYMIQQNILNLNSLKFM